MISHLLLVLLLPVYVNLVKELFLSALFLSVPDTVFPKASAKVLHFPEPAKFFTEYFQKIMHFPGFDDRNQGKLTIFGGYEQDIAEMRGEPNSARRRGRRNYLLTFAFSVAE